MRRFFFVMCQTYTVSSVSATDDGFNGSRIVVLRVETGKLTSKVVFETMGQEPFRVLRSNLSKINSL